MTISLRSQLLLLPVALLGLHLTRPVAPAQAAPFYSHGDPSPQEQLLLELVNRARRNPPTEGARLGRAGEFAGYGVRPPLAFHAALSNAARGHNNDMAANNFFSHTGSNGSQPGDRAVAAGYPGAALSVGENVSLGFPDPQAALDSLMIDAGVPNLDHRRNFLDLFNGNNFYRETGIAFDTDARALNTQVFATRPAGIITGSPSRTSTATASTPRARAWAGSAFPARRAASSPPRAAAAATPCRWITSGTSPRA